MFAIIILCTLVILLWLVNSPGALRFYHRYRFAKTLPGPSMLDLIRLDKRKSGRVVEWLEQNRQRYGSVYRFWLGADLLLHVSDPDMVRQVLSSNEMTAKGSGYFVLYPWLGQGLLSHVGGEAYQRRRKMLTPAFHFKILSQFKEPIDECCDVMCERLAKVADGQTTLNLYDYTGPLMLDIICETAMGTKMNVQVNKESAILKATEIICHLLHVQMIGTWTRVPFLFNNSSLGRARDAAIRVVHDETKRVIQLRRELINSDNTNTGPPSDAENDDDNNVYTTSKRRRVAFLDSLLLAQREGADLTDENILEEVCTFMFGGHDTTSTALAYALFHLSRDERVQRRAYEEAIEMGPLHDANEPRPYLEAIIKETMRLYAIVPMYSRTTQKPFRMGKLTVPAGTTVVVISYLVHRDPDFYPDPERFWPERFVDGEAEGARKEHPFAHIPFSAGPRNCIGQRFALLELKAILTRLLRQFEWLPVDGFKPTLVPELVLKSANGLPVRLRQR